MPSVSPLLDSVLNALNKANNTAVAQPADVRIKSFVPNGAKATVTLQGKASKPNYGEYAVEIDRVNLTDLFGKTPTGLGTSLQIAGTATVAQLLMQIGYRYGVRLPANEFQSGAITWANGTATVTLRAVDTSPHFYGSVTLTLVETWIDIATAFPTRNYASVTTQMTEQSLATQLETPNNRPYPLELFDFSNVQLVADAGVSLGSYNSTVTVVGRPGSGYSGSYNVFFSRIDLSTYAGKTTYIPDDFTGGFEEMFAVNTLLSGLIGLTDLVPQPVDFTHTPASVLFKAADKSFVCYGEATATVSRYSDDVQTVDIVLSSDTGASKGWLETRAKAIVPSCGKLILNLTVNANVTLGSSDVTVPALELTKMSTYGTVEFHLKNLGTIAGCGSAFGAFTVSSEAGPGVSISPTFNGTIEFDNQGLIAGGGGGGSSVSKFGTNSTWYYSQGGGGRPYGRGSNNSSTTTSRYYNGSAGTLVAPGVGGGKGIYTGNGYIASGDGGDVGEPGKPGYTRASDGGSWKPSNDSDGLRPPGKSIIGSLELIKWVNHGTVKPHYNDKLAKFQAYVDSQTDIKQGAPTDTVYTYAVSNATVTFAMKWVGGNSSYLNDYFTAVGDPMGYRTLGNSNLNGLFAACAPNANVAGCVGRQGMLALFTLQPAAVGVAVPATVRNNLSISAAVASASGWNVTSFIYYDPYLDEVMECNPFLKTTPVKWSGMKDDLSATNGDLDGF